MNIILCPYCLSPVAETAAECPSCGLDMTRDAKHEMTPQEYQALETEPCEGCGEPIPTLAVKCAHCGDGLEQD